jgi:hypothetical protein
MGFTSKALLTVARPSINLIPKKAITNYLLMLRVLIYYTKPMLSLSDNVE